MPDSAAELVPSRPTLPRLREAAADCRACPLWERGDADGVRRGPRARRRSCSSASSRATRRISQGRPFVGPAGRLLDDALARGRDRPRRRLRHERGQALQVGGARQAAHPRQAELERARGVPALAGGRAGGRASRASSSAWARRRRSRCSASSSASPSTAASGWSRELAERVTRDDPPERDPASAATAGEERAGGVRRGSEVRGRRALAAGGRVSASECRPSRKAWAARLRDLQIQ